MQIDAQPAGLHCRIRVAESLRFLEGSQGEHEHAAQVAAVRERAGEDQLPRIGQLLDVRQVGLLQLGDRGRLLRRPAGAAIEEPERTRRLRRAGRSDRRRAFAIPACVGRRVG